PGDKGHRASMCGRPCREAGTPGLWYQARASSTGSTPWCRLRQRGWRALFPGMIVNLQGRTTRLEVQLRVARRFPKPLADFVRIGTPLALFHARKLILVSSMVGERVDRVGFWIIGTYKAIKAVALLAVGVFFIYLGQTGVSSGFAHLGAWLRLSPD